MSGRVVRKVVTEKEIESGRISLPAVVRDCFFGNVAENSKTDVTLEDIEMGDTHRIVLKVRENATKPEIMAKGGRLLVHKRKISSGDSLLFPLSDSGQLSAGRLGFMVEKKPRLSPTPSLPVFSSLISFSQLMFHEQLPPPAPAPPLLEAVWFGYDMPIAPASAETMPFGSGHAAVKPVPVLPQLGLSIGSNNSQLTLELSLSIGSDDAPPNVALRSSAGGETIILKGVKQEVEMVQQMGPTVLDLELTLGSLYSQELKLKRPQQLGRDPTTPLVSAPPAAETIGSDCARGAAGVLRSHQHSTCSTRKQTNEP